MEIYFLYYIINFINNEYKICHTLAETYCGKSILGIQTDSFFKIQGSIHQFIYKKHHYCVRNPKCTTQNKIIEEPWMIHLIQNDYTNRMQVLNTNNGQNHFRYVNINEATGFESQQIFYVKKIELKIKKKVFDRIVNYPDSNKKEYESEDLFYICYSYVFSFLDNQSIILQNILNLIIQEKFDLNSINQEFIKFVSSKHHNSQYFQNFTEELSQKREIDIQSKIEQFVSDNYNYIHLDAFLNELFQWKTKLSNLFTLIQQTFCFQIFLNSDILLVQIYHEYEPDQMFNILIKDIEYIMFLISNNCIISCISFTSDTKSFFCDILSLKQDITLNLDLREFYINLYGYEKDILINHAKQLDEFVLFLSQKTKKQITICIKKRQMLIQYNIKTNQWILSKKDTTELHDIDELLLVSKRIMIFEMDLQHRILMNIAQIIISDFIGQKDEITQDVIIHHDETREKIIQNDNVLNFLISSNQKIEENGIYEIHSYNFINTILLCGYNNSGSKLVGLECINQIYTDFEFICGIHDGEFSLLELNDKYNMNMPTNICNFVTKMSNLFDLNDRYNLKSNSHQYFESLIIEPDIENILIFCSLSNKLKHCQPTCSSSSKVHILSQLLEYSCSCNLNIMKCFNLNNQEMKIYHNFRDTKKHEQLQKQHYSQLLLPVIDLKLFFFQFEIEKSNFHIIISRIFEVKSLAKSTSLITKSLNEYGASLKIIHCDIKFLCVDFTGFDFILFKHCELKYRLHFLSCLYTQNEYNITITDSYHNQQIILDNFTEIQMHDRRNYFSFTKRYSNFYLIIFNSDINFYTRIPAEYIYISLYKCRIISVKNNILLKTNASLPDNIDFHMNLLSIHDHSIFQMIDKAPVSIFKLSNCVLPLYLNVKGTFNWIIIINCVSPFIIEAYFNKLQIIDHSEDFKITNMVSKAIANQSKSIFIYNKIELIIRNFDIECLMNLCVHKIQLFNCSIKSFYNIRCKNLLIQNTNCSFRLTFADKIIDYSSKNLDLIYSENQFMLLNTNS